MPSLYVGGYFSQLVISALYPVLVDEKSHTLAAGALLDAAFYSIPLDGVTALGDAAVNAVNLVTALAPVPYKNEEASHMFGVMAVTSVDLRQVLITYSNKEQSHIFNSMAVTDVTLRTVLITYNNVEKSHTFNTMAITAINLV